MSKLTIKNYTSSMPVERSVQLIERELVECGATNIIKQYTAGVIQGITFQIDDPSSTGHLVPISLPARVEKIEAFFIKKLGMSGPKLKEQAERTAWKTLLEWVQIQMGFVKTNRADLLEVFLAYVWRGEKTYYQELKETKFLALENK